MQLAQVCCQSRAGGRQGLLAGQQRDSGAAGGGLCAGCAPPAPLCFPGAALVASWHGTTLANGLHGLLGAGTGEGSSVNVLHGKDLVLVLSTSSLVKTQHKFIYVQLRCDFWKPLHHVLSLALRFLFVRGHHQFPGIFNRIQLDIFSSVYIENI